MVNGFVEEFTKTKEMALAWIFRAGMALVLSLGTGMLWMAWGSLQEVRADLKHNAEMQWTAITTLTANQNQAAAAAAVMATTLTDHIRQEAGVIDDIHAELKDHEARIRGVETARPIR
jgi:hypothetical protein